MACRVLLRASALGLAAAAGGSLHAVSKWRTPWTLSPAGPFTGIMVLESAQGLQAALLGAHPLSGAHLRDVSARAECDLARVDVLGAEGNPAAATDLRLLLALLATRDGRTDDALRLYEEAARDSPFDARPRALAYQLSVFVGRIDEVAHWRAAYRRLVPEIDRSTPPGFEFHETRELIRELVVAATLSGVYNFNYPRGRWFLLPAACGAVDKGLVDSLEDRTLSTAERLQVRALRGYLQIKVRHLIRKEKREFDNGGAEAAPVS